MKLFLEVLTGQKEWHSHDVSVCELGNCDAARFWRIIQEEKKRRTKSRWDILWQKEISFFKALREYVVSNNPFLKKKLAAFSRTSHLRKMIRTEKQSLSFVMDLPQLLLFFVCFLLYFSSSGNFHEAWTHRRTTIIMSVSGKLILTIIQISNWNESQIQRFDSISVTFC